jgi:ABC-type molybdate transport system permease subunit
MTEQQQTEILLKHLVRIAVALERMPLVLAPIATALQSIDSQLNEVVAQGKSGRAYLSVVTRNSPE